MTTVIKTKKIGNYTIELIIDRRYNINYYEVATYYLWRHDTSQVYGIDEEKKAKRCFYRYCAMARKFAN